MIVEITPDEFWAREEVAALIEGYEAESRIEGLPPANPNVPMYQAMHQAGALRVLAFIKDEKMEGFAVVMISPVAHYSAKLAVMESLYVVPVHRGSGAGWRLIKTAERLAKEAGAVGMFVSAPAGGTLEGVMESEQSGYEHSNTVFFRALK